MDEHVSLCEASEAVVGCFCFEIARGVLVTALGLKSGYRGMCIQRAEVDVPLQVFENGVACPR